MFSFLSENKYVEHEVQKGFTPKVSGTFEHTSQMAYLINHARIKQPSLVITLLDLKNAFGEVHHNLITEVLNYHHMPKKIQKLISSLYTGFHTSVITKSFATPYILVGRGVLQGDPLSPLTFSLIFNTFIRYIKSEQFEQFGYRYSNILTPKHWFQFADDAAVVTRLESENQVMLNAFSCWCNWSNMIIRVDKCCTLGIRKIETSSIQYSPKLFVNNKIIPAIKDNKDFIYLGRSFSFKMNNSYHKLELVSNTKEFLEKISSLPLHPRNKLLLYNNYVLSKLVWHLTIADLGLTWVKYNFVGLFCSLMVRNPIQRHNRYCTVIKRFERKFGLNIITFSTKFTQSQTSIRKRLQNSKNHDIRKIHQLTSYESNIQFDQFSSAKQVIKSIRDNKVNKICTQLTSQGSVITEVWENVLVCTKSNWFSVRDKMPSNIYNFVNRYLNNSLPTLKNMLLWGTSNSMSCLDCGNSLTLLHVMSGCEKHLHQGRYTWRHNSVLKALASFLLPRGIGELYVDLEGFCSPSEVTGDSKRPDMLIVRPDGTLYLVELTVCYETNMPKNAQIKSNRYETTIEHLKSSFTCIKFVNLVVSALGIFYKDSKTLITMFEDSKISRQEHAYIIRKISNIAIRTSYYIFCMKDKSWSNPELMSY